MVGKELPSFKAGSSERLARLILSVLFLVSPYLVLMIPQSANGQTRGSESGVTTPSADDVLARALEKSAVVQVIVVLDTDSSEAPIDSFQPRSLVLDAPFALQQADVSRRLRSQGFRVKRSFRTLPALVTEVDKAGLVELRNTPGVRDVLLDELHFPTLNGTIPIIKAGTLHQIGIEGAGYAVAILDTGIERSHPMFADGNGNSRVVAEACFSSNVSSVSSRAESLCPNGQGTQFGEGAAADCSGTSGCGHGTHVAGIAAGSAVTLGGTELVGVAPASDIIGIQVFSEFTGPTDCAGSPPCVASYGSDQLAALEWLLMQDQSQGGNLKVASANMSLGGGSYQAACGTYIASGIDALWAVGIPTVIATGNDGYSDRVSGPACYDRAIAVGATTDGDLVASYSNAAADLVDLYAPGSSVIAAGLNGGYVAKSGTSMATPHVAGAWALLRDAGAGDGTGAGLEATLSIVQQTGISISSRQNAGDLGYAHPRIDLSAALERLNSTDPWLSVSISGSGQVTSSPAGIECGPTCSTAISIGDEIQLLATPSQGYLLAEWSGCDEVTNDACTVSVSDGVDRLVSANFVLIPPSNDDFANAFVLINNPFATTASTQGATFEPMEPLPTCDGTAGRSVWYQWTPPSDGRLRNVEVNTSGSNYDTTLDILAGVELSNLSSVVCDFGTVENAYTDSRVSFIATPGQPYFIRISGFQATGGEAVLNWSFQIATRELSISVLDSTYGTVSSDVGINCGHSGSDCQVEVPLNDTVTLTATATARGLFLGWGGACEGTESTEPCVLESMSEDVTVEARFGLQAQIFHDQFDGDTTEL